MYATCAVVTVYVFLCSLTRTNFVQSVDKPSTIISRSPLSIKENGMSHVYRLMRQLLLTRGLNKLSSSPQMKTSCSKDLASSEVTSVRQFLGCVEDYDILNHVVYTTCRLLMFAYANTSRLKIHGMGLLDVLIAYYVMCVPCVRPRI